MTTERAWLRRLEYVMLAALCVAVFVSCSPWMSPPDKSEVAGVDETIVGEGKGKGADAPSPSPTPSPSTTAPGEPSTDTDPDTVGNAATRATTTTNGNGKGNGNGPGKNGSSASNDPKGSFGVDLGAVQTLYPSLRRTVAVTFSNPWKVGIEVRSATVRVSVPADRAAGCPASYVVVTPADISARTPVRVPARGTATSSFAVTLSGDAPDSCQGVPFGLALDATGGKS